ncbi:hypothetical protein [Fodinibius salsisoli]|uniref:Uncharacterized protein n=1 Tax=Fodinibius salsisoli TaxID=2820877 RepID=A0ABT3PIQ4_9BACT|nr:hypothetical protein [Fodinibius salsisoli]MCW9705810.1 hypothetical protein [Fodinibius salsisoli]
MKLLSILFTAFICICCLSCTNPDKSPDPDKVNTTKADKTQPKNSVFPQDESTEPTYKAIALEGAEVISFEDGRGYYYQSCPVHGVVNRSKKAFTGISSSIYTSGFRCTKGDQYHKVRIEIIKVD